MRVCAKEDCNNNIENLHGNNKYCITCMEKPKVKRTIVYREDVIKISVKDFKELQRLAAIGKHHEQDKKVCEHCFKCNSLNGICQKYGIPNTEVH